MISIIVALLLLLGIVYHAIERHIILPGYTSLETQLAVKDIGRCRAAIKGEIRHLDNLVNDWAVWDDTYRFKELAASRPFISIEQGHHRLLVYDTMTDYQGRD